MVRFAPLLLLALAGCEPPTGPSERQALEVARARWVAQGSPSYTYELSRECFCVLSARWVQLTVEEGSVVTAEYVDSKTSVEAALVRYLQTIPDLFDVIEDALNRHAASFRAVYDPVFGFPTRIEIDYSATTADDELAFTARAFTPTPTLTPRP